MVNSPIDLRKYLEPLHAFLKRSLGSFVHQHPDIEVSSIVFYVFPYERVGGLCFDTKANSDRMVATWQHNGPAWYGEDQFGRFNNSPEDCAYSDFTDFEFPEFPDLYAEEDPLVFVDSEGGIQAGNREEQGDEGINRAMFPSLCRFLRDFHEWKILRRSAPFRVGVVMHDSECVDYWCVD